MPMMPIVGVSASADGDLFASIAEDESTKVWGAPSFKPSNLHEKRRLGILPCAGLLMWGACGEHDMGWCM